MPTLSSAGWVIHDVGLATAMGGSMFGKVALQRAIGEVSDMQERDQVSDVAWRRFSWINLASHVAFAVPWFIGRSMLDGSEVSPRARALTRTKDALVIASLASGIASIVLGRVLGRRVRRGEGPGRMHEVGEMAREAVRERAGQPMGERMQERAMDTARIARRGRGLSRTVGVLGLVNLLATAGVMAVSSLLAMEASQSLRFAGQSRRLP